MLTVFNDKLLCTCNIGKPFFSYEVVRWISCMDLLTTSNVDKHTCHNCKVPVNTPTYFNMDTYFGYPCHVCIRYFHQSLYSIINKTQHILFMSGQLTLLYLFNRGKIFTILPSGRWHVPMDK